MPNPLRPNPLAQAVLDVVNPVLQTRVHGAPGHIVRLYEQQRLADVVVDLGGNKQLYKAVTFSGGLGVIDSYDEGERVWIDFKGGSIQDPIIVSKYQPELSWQDNATHEAQFDFTTTIMNGGS